jgi:hypothetical protein
VQVEYPEFVQIMTTKLDKQNEDAYAPKDDSMHKTMILDKLSTQIMNLKIFGHVSFSVFVLWQFFATW